MCSKFGPLASTSACLNTVTDNGTLDILVSILPNCNILQSLMNNHGMLSSFH